MPYPSRLRYKGMWLATRVMNLPDNCDTACVKKALEVGETTVRRWMADEYFNKAKVATWEEKYTRDVAGEQEIVRKWTWDKNKLLLWLIAIGSLVIPPSSVAENPGKSEVVDKKQARQSLGMPANYRLT